MMFPFMLNDDVTLDDLVYRPGKKGKTVSFEDLFNFDLPPKGEEMVPKADVVAEIEKYFAGVLSDIVDKIDPKDTDAAVIAINKAVDAGKHKEELVKRVKSLKGMIPVPVGKGD